MNCCVSESQRVPGSCDERVRVCIIREVPLPVILAVAELIRAHPKSDNYTKRRK